jgi:ribosomal protein S27E
MGNCGPLLHDMVDRGLWLLIRCLHCGREKVISGHEACYVYGHGLR